MKLNDYLIILNNGTIIINQYTESAKLVYQILYKGQFACHYTNDQRVLCLILEAAGLVSKRRFNDSWDDFCATNRGIMLRRRIEQKLKINQE